MSKVTYEIYSYYPSLFPNGENLDRIDFYLFYLENIIVASETFDSTPSRTEWWLKNTGLKLEGMHLFKS